MKNKLPIKMIDWYKREISPNLSPRCRYIPTCSEYARCCYEKFSFAKASYLTTKRLLKCNPLFKGGYDPVPLTKEEKERLKEENQKNEEEKLSEEESK